MQLLLLSCYDPKTSHCSHTQYTKILLQHLGEISNSIILELVPRLFSCSVKQSDDDNYNGNVVVVWREEEEKKRERERLYLLPPES